MLGKLLKFEFRDSGRVYLPLYLAGIVMAAVIGFASLAGVNRDSDLAGSIKSLVIVLLVILVIALFVIAFLMIIRKFFNGLLGEGGYFSFTLPATVHEHIGAKLICSVVMVIACILAAFIMIMLANLPFCGEFFEALGVLFEQLGKMISKYPLTLLIIFEGIIALLLSLCFSILKLYLAMALGHLSNTHRGGLSIVAYLVLGWLSTLLLVWLFSLVYQTGAINAIVSNPDANALTATAQLLGIYLGVMTLVCGLFWAVISLILSRSLNIL